MNKVYLVGAGPGDPELITVKGQRVLQLADCVLYDHLASSSLLQHAPPGAERIYVGKRKSAHSHKQEEITEMMIERARRGQNVVRLKGGDPYIFGRGGEEVEALAEAGIAFEVVPGVTSPLGIAAYTGVPLTHREHTSVVTFVTGHDVGGIDWKRIGVSETLVIFMGVHFVVDIVRELLASGRSPSTPAMCVRWGTRPDQLTVQGTLASLPRLVQEAGLKPPATMIIGDVVLLRKKLDWFEHLPLFGQRIVVTRSASQAGELSSLLREQAADVVEVPVIALEPLDDYTELDAAIRALETYSWLIFTSTNAVEFFLARLKACGRDFRAIRGLLCAIGDATRRALEQAGLIVDLQPAEAVSESVVEAFAGHSLDGAKVLLPRASAAREVIPEALRAAGADVHVVDAYRNVIPPNAEALAQEVFDGSPKPDWVIFTSSSTVKNLVALVGRDRLEGVRVASIGPITSNTARMHGLAVEVEAAEATMRALVGGIVAACSPDYQI
ncbi:MAG TPA: uroporphyrinogen-III C-methyltransferase [Bryobacteraceae bacterium]|nr:uroporphyrinogen-III C-methyltransferase [Bryobacteraceae bacterium]